MMDLKPQAGDGGPQVVSVPAYLAERLEGRFGLVLADAKCPFCMGAKNVDALACYSCYGSRLGEVGDDDLVVLEGRENVLRAERRSGEQALLVEPVEAAGARLPAEVKEARVRLTLSRFILLTMLAWAAMVCVVVVALWASYARRPSVVVVHPPPRVVDVAAPATDSPDVGDPDRRTAALLFVKTFYDVDPETRRADVETALKMMKPETASEVAKYLKDSGVLEQERRQGIRAWWQRESVEFDEHDPMTVRLRGRRVVKRAGLPDAYDPMLITLKLVVDPRGRTPENQNTGLLVGGIKVDKPGG